MIGNRHCLLQRKEDFVTPRTKDVFPALGINDTFVQHPAVNHTSMQAKLRITLWLEQINTHSYLGFVHYAQNYIICEYE